MTDSGSDAAVPDSARRACGDLRLGDGSVPMTLDFIAILGGAQTSLGVFRFHHRPDEAPASKELAAILAVVEQFYSAAPKERGDLEALGSRCAGALITLGVSGAGIAELFQELAAVNTK